MVLSILDPMHSAQRSTAFTIFAAVVLFATSAEGQSRVPPRDGAVRTATLLDEIPSVFGASRFDQLATEAPASVAVITAEDIASHGWRTLGEALQSVRGFYLIDDGVYPSIGSRAFGPPGDYNSRLLLVIDGHRINENVYDATGMSFDGMLDLQDVERMEVIRGPVSSLYGNSAFFGVVNVVTTRGRALGGARVRASVESFGTRGVSAAVGDRLAGGVEAYLSAGSRRSDGRDFYFAEFDTAATGGFARHLDGEARDRATLRLGWGPLALTGMFNLRRKDVATGRYGVDYGVAGNRMTDNTSMIGVAFDREVTATSSVRAQASFNAYDYSGNYVYSGESTSDWTKGRWLIVESQYATTIPGGHRLLVGGQGSSSMRQVQGARDSGGVTFYDDTRPTVVALFAQDEWRLGADWLLNTGLRLDHYSSFGLAANPRVAIIRSLGSGSAIKLLYGSAFRMSTSYERLYEDFILQANPTLGPERIRTGELLLERRIGTHLKLTSSIFHNSVTDLIELVPTSTPGSQQYQNAGRNSASGVEGEVEFEWLGAHGRASHGWQHGRDLSREVDLPNAPKHVTMADLVVALPREITSSLEMHTLSSRTSVAGSRVPGYAVANWWLKLPWPRHAARLSTGVYNLTNTQFSDPTGAEFQQQAIPQAGRRFRVALELGGR